MPAGSCIYANTDRTVIETENCPQKPKLMPAKRSENRIIAKKDNIANSFRATLSFIAS
jgi:hypothetical protein